MVTLTIKIKENGKIELKNVLATDISANISAEHTNPTIKEIKVSKIILNRIRQNSENSISLNDDIEVFNECVNQKENETISKLFAILSKI